MASDGMLGGYLVRLSNNLKNEVANVVVIIDTYTIPYAKIWFLKHAYKALQSRGRYLMHSLVVHLHQTFVCANNENQCSCRTRQSIPNSDNSSISFKTNNLS